ncbi:MAG: hypothetical protein NC094_12205 [Bacteroidales bacterium]|nr:hypothetical protein [Lachnoclostridium sp.]MCM1385390.1 hypothetical protein [Lachnoclostridium sp.]MCM1466172.1 hypothetical protein [Bacteroidales bacterium]
MNEKSTPKNINEQDLEAIISLLDRYSEAGGSRMKLNVVEGDGEIVDRQYHHGRCDIGSPWAMGQAFDVLE